MVLALLSLSSADRKTTNWPQHAHEIMECQYLEVHPPAGLDLSQNEEYASQAALWGVEVKFIYHCFYIEDVSPIVFELNVFF